MRVWLARQKSRTKEGHHGVSSSNGNTLTGSNYGSAPSNASSTGSPYSQSYGIAVGMGNLHNNFLDITAQSNTSFDAPDENPNCKNRFLDDIVPTSKGTPATSCEIDIGIVRPTERPISVTSRKSEYWNLG